MHLKPVSFVFFFCFPINIDIERDERFPIRFTWQYYRVTDTVNLPAGFLAETRAKIDRVYSNGEATGSLVTEGHTNRSTESAPNISHSEIHRAPLSSFM